MARKKAMLFGALYGGVVGPALGGFLLGFSGIVVDEYMTWDRVTTACIVFPTVAVLVFGLPGLFFGVIGALILQAMLRKILNQSAQNALASVTGGLMGLLAVGAFNLWSKQPLVQFDPFFLAAGISGAFTSFVFARQLRSARTPISTDVNY